MGRAYQVLVAAMGRVSGELKENGYQLPAILETQLCTSGLLCNGRVIFGRVTCLESWLCFLEGWEGVSAILFKPLKHNILL